MHLVTWYVESCGGGSGRQIRTRMEQICGSWWLELRLEGLRALAMRHRWRCKHQSITASDSDTVWIRVATEDDGHPTSVRVCA